MEREILIDLLNGLGYGCGSVVSNGETIVRNIKTAMVNTKFEISAENAKNGYDIVFKNGDKSIKVSYDVKDNTIGSKTVIRVA